MVLCSGYVLAQWLKWTGPNGCLASMSSRSSKNPKEIKRCSWEVNLFLGFSKKNKKTKDLSNGASN